MMKVYKRSWQQGEVDECVWEGLGGTPGRAWCFLGMELDGDGGMQKDFQGSGWSNQLDSGADTRKRTTGWRQVQEGKDSECSVNMLSLKSDIHVAVVYMVVQFV